LTSHHGAFLHAYFLHEPPHMLAPPPRAGSLKETSSHPVDRTDEFASSSAPARRVSRALAPA
jgi:hypothetical protein